MQFMLAMIGDEARWEQMSPEEMQAFGEGIDAYNDELRKAGAWVTGAGLQGKDTAKTVRFGADGEPTVTDAPFSDAREQLGGWWIVECDSVDEAVEWAKKAPMGDGALEVRPLVSE
jgi:hypothetical protein